MANLEWASRNGTGTQGAANKWYRHVINDDQLPVNSKLDSATMPCIVVNSINWPTVPADKVTVNISDYSGQLSMSDSILFSWVNSPGNAVLFDPSNTTLQLPFKNSLDQSFWLGIGLGDLFTQPHSCFPVL
jgi:hypothetical protein